MAESDLSMNRFERSRGRAKRAYAYLGWRLPSGQPGAFVVVCRSRPDHTLGTTSNNWNCSRQDPMSTRASSLKREIRILQRPA